MRLIEAIREAADWHEDDILYVSPPWSPDADIVFVATEGNEAAPVSFHGREYQYFLETFIARDFLEDYASTVEGAPATDRERCERLIRYAQNDA